VYPLLPCLHKELTHSLIKKIRDYLEGFFLHGLYEGIFRKKSCLDELFMLAIFGKEIGFPGLFSYYHLRLLPYYLKRLDPWKRRVLRERDFFDHISD
jgi:hypothetical protein